MREQIDDDRSADAMISILPTRAVYGAYPSVNQSRGKERNLHLLENVYQMGSSAKLMNIACLLTAL
jgi:hypothetical protein